MRSFVVAGLIILAAACNGALDAGPAQGAATTVADCCAGQPAPAHLSQWRCANGSPSPVCEPDCRWRVDCVPSGPPAADGLGVISSCTESQCGAPPAFDDSECRYPLRSGASKPECYSLNRDACTWHPRCGPKPCSVAEGTCDVLDRSRLGAPCGVSGGPCAKGSSCVYIGEGPDPVCVEGDACTPLKCAPGKMCVVLESSPAQVMCTPCGRPWQLRCPQ